MQLSPSQQQAFDSLWQLCSEGKGGEQALLYGVTGSGKSQVYLKLAERVREQGRGVIILVPEISLTPQTVELFGRRFGQHVAVLHSGLTMAERADEYKRIKQGLADVVVGTRSAVFAPVKKIGLIVIDEEQEGAYASQQAPRYHAREIARLRCPAAWGAAADGVGHPFGRDLLSGEAGEDSSLYPLPPVSGQPAAQGADCGHEAELRL